MQVLQRHPAILVDEGADVLLQARFVHVAATGPVQQHVGDRLRLLPDQPVQQLRDLEAALFGDRTDHAEVDHADAAVTQVDDVARVRVGVETAVLQHHLQHDAGPGACKPDTVETGGIDAGQVAPGDAVDEVLHVEALAGPLPMHLGDQDVVAAGEVARDALGIAAFGGEVEFAPQRDLELLHHFGRAVALQIGQPRFDDVRQPCQQAQVGFDHLADAGAADLQHHRAAVVQGGPVGLGERRGRHRGFVQPGEDLMRRRAKVVFQLLADLRIRQGRYRVLQLGELGDPVRREQVDAGGQDLAEFDEGRAEVFHRPAHADRGGHAQDLLGVVPVQQPAGAFEHVSQADPAHQVAEAVADQDRGDFLQAPQVTDGSQRFPHRCTLVRQPG